MTSLALGHLPSLWRQHLLSEFAGLKQACPEGVFVSLTPGDPSLWSAVLFVRHGPYAPAVLRFQILFPDAYPRAPPLVTFSTDIFHPLITPLTTHMYPTSVENDGSTTERPRLPPGGFSLEHGFPEWFGGPERLEAESRQGSRERRGASPSAASTKSATSKSGKAPSVPPKDVPRYMQTDRRTISTYSLLKYIRNTFDKAEVLDTVPLAASGNPGAWHAWRTHRRKQRKALDENKNNNRLSRLSILSDLQPKENVSEQGDMAGSDARSIASQSTMAREPGEWNWDGVWEDRVKKGVASTLTESVLYGASGISDDMIHFLALEEGTIEAVKGNLRRTLDASA
ncbi:ubiquitin-conjugating enzyme/RWD-like protein [Trichoderma barbatum]